MPGWSRESGPKDEDFDRAVKNLKEHGQKDKGLDTMPQNNAQRPQNYKKD